MISCVKGTLAVVSESEVIVEAGTFGIAVKTFRAVIKRLLTKGVEFLLHTYLRMSEDAVSLYGFNREVGLRLFRALLGVSGIGPKGVLVVLSALKPKTLKLAVLTSDAKVIARTPGIGIRTAERIILGFKNQEVVQTLSAGTVPGGNVSGAAATEAIDALVQLDYGIGKATRAIRAVPEAEKKGGETLLREALWRLRT